MENENLRATAKWEYEALQRDMEAQERQSGCATCGKTTRWEYRGGFENWYKEVFLVDEAWAEIREEAVSKL